MSKKPPGNKAMLGQMAPNLNLSVSLSSLSSAIYPRQVVPQPGISSAAPEIITLESGPKISEKSADLSLKVGNSGSNCKPVENLFPANPASVSPFPKQQINVYHRRSSLSTWKYQFSYDH